MIEYASVVCVYAIAPIVQKDIATNVAEGSTVTVVNRKDHKEFKRIVVGELGFEQIVENEKGGTFRLPQGTAGHNLELSHLTLDPADFETMRKVFKEQKAAGKLFDAAIVLGTVAGRVVSPYVMDARVLSILLILRKLNPT